MWTDITNTFPNIVRITFAFIVILLLCLNKASNLTCKLKQTNYYSKQFQSALTRAFPVNITFPSEPVLSISRNQHTRRCLLRLVQLRSFSYLGELYLIAGFRQLVLELFAAESVLGTESCVTNFVPFISVCLNGYNSFLSSARFINFRVYTLILMLNFSISLPPMSRSCKLSFSFRVSH